MRVDPRVDIPLIEAPSFGVTYEEAFRLSFMAAGAWIQVVRGMDATPVGYGCRAEGPHGPVRCGSIYTAPGGPECDCGCSAFEDYCEIYLAWYAEKYPVGLMEGAAAKKVRAAAWVDDPGVDIVGNPR